MSSVASSSRTFGRPTSPPHDIDLEAQLTQPSPAHTHIPRKVSIMTDAVNDFFGASPNQNASPICTRDSRHDDAPPSVVRSMAGEAAAAAEDVLPPYEHSVGPPVYSAVSNQPTLAMYLFKFGFLFPLFWVAGALILFSPLSAPPEWEETKSPLEREELIVSMRRAEVKWARRCLIALSVFALVVLAIVLTVVFSTRS